jgi:uncharacterized membrane protein YebE (DUF533 family)
MKKAIIVILVIAAIGAAGYLATEHIKNLKEKQFNNMKKIIIIGGSILAVSILAYVGYKWYKRKKETTNNKPPLGTTARPFIPPNYSVPISNADAFDTINHFGLVSTTPEVPG